MDKIVGYIEEAMKAALPVEPMNFPVNSAHASKTAKIQLLKMELQAIKNTAKPDWEYVRFQLSSSLTLLISAFITNLMLMNNTVMMGINIDLSSHICCRAANTNKRTCQRLIVIQ
ncbi:hypothetical protein [Mucilaginibacter agri]|uniref:Uncharacterized protein n=1 Tax=Mucilaginibacter agri TaxID=2695265 RepID=A0A965ZEN3_9SPHI|nr:hypothetical protein [Mucilaginibacter agri]NCD68371.1 hypothetical protein [Mucilaginibacter agri]